MPVFLDVAETNKIGHEEGNSFTVIFKCTKDISVFQCGHYAAEEMLGCAKIYTDISHGLGTRRRYCFINSMNLSEAGDLYDRELKMLFLIMKTIIPEVARCFSYLKEV